MKNLSSRFESIKSYVPNILSSSKEKVTELFTLMTQSESDFLTKAENTDSEIKELLNSKMEMEVILGLKFLMIHVLKGIDISKFQSSIVNLYLSTNPFIKTICLNLIDHLAMEKRDVLILLYNSVSKKVSDNDPLQRWSVLHLITAMKNQSISSDCSKQIIPMLSDSNVVIRRLALISLVQYLKSFSNSNQNVSISDEELTGILKMYFNDPHPLIFSTGFYAICELKNRDYLSLNIAQKFVFYCDYLKNIDNFYYERVVFSLINFSNLFLLNNFDKNHKYVNILFNSLYKCVKYSTDISKIISSLYGIYEIIIGIDKLKLNSMSKDEVQLFKNGRRLKSIGNVLLKLVMCSRHDHDKFTSLELVLKFAQGKDQSSYLYSVRENLEKSFNVFYVKINDKEYINIKKLEILISLSNESNIKIILEEFKRNLNFPNLNLKKMVIKSIYHICKLNSDNKENVSSSKSISISKISIPSLCIEKLIDLLKLKEEGVISQIIICLRKLILEIKDQTKFVLIYNIKNYKKNVTSSIAKANIIWMISQYIDVIPTVSVDFFRRLLMEIDQESDNVKSALLGFAIRINANLNLISSQYTSELRDMTVARIKNLITYTIDKLLWDKNYNIREKSRMVDFIIKNNLFDKQMDFLTDYYSNANNNNINEDNSSLKLLQNEDRTYSLSIANKISTDTKSNFDNNEDHGISFNNKKFEFDTFSSTAGNISAYNKICLDDIISFKKNEESENKSRKTVLDSQKFTSVIQQDNVNNTIQNFSGSLDVEELKMKMKNQLDDFLNEDEDEDQYEVEIRKD